MNLEQLAGRWQQQAPSTPFSASLHLPDLAGQPGNSPVARMLRNLWWEIAGLLLIGTPILLGLLRFSSPTMQLLAGIVAVLYFGSGSYYGYKLLLLRRLRAAGGSLRAHLQRQVSSLRRLLKAGFLTTMGFTVLAGGGLAYVALHQGRAGLLQPAEGRFMVWLVLTVLVSYVVTYWCLHWHLQYSYGQHLDRLEQALQELADEPAN